ncbi:MAG: SCP2 sterol-binding domain-containing protein [Myxococcota bacterium]
MTVKDVISEMEGRITSDPAKTREEIDGVFKFVVTGDGGGTWVVNCRDVGVTEGDGDAECTITVGDDTFVAIADGSMDAMQAFMTGMIQIEGDMGLAMKLQQVM